MDYNQLFYKNDIKQNLLLNDLLKRANLTDKQQFALSRHFDGWRLREIAAEMGTTKQTVHKHICRAKIRLRASAYLRPQTIHKSQHNF